jgi:hypothetical protein
MNMKNDKLTVPCILGFYCAENQLINELKLLCSLKLVHNNSVLSESINNPQLKEYFGRRDKRTLKKHLNSLIKLNWVGYDEKTRLIHVRGWQRILSDLKKNKNIKIEESDKTKKKPKKKFKNRSYKYVEFQTNYFKDFDAFLLSIVVDKLVKGFKHYLKE